jgi:hypothetical protein
MRQCRIPRVALQDVMQSAWKTLFNSGSNQAFITLTGIDFATFHWLLPKCCALYDSHSPFSDPDGSIIALPNFPINQGGRPRMMYALDFVLPGPGPGAQTWCCKSSYE